MTIEDGKRSEATDEIDACSHLFQGSVSRREFLAGAAAFGVTIALSAESTWAADGKKTFTILHTNDMHSNFIGMGPSSDYTPLTLNDDKTTGGYARIAAVIATRKKVRESQGPVLILDAGDFSMGTPFAAASREIGGELQVMSRMGYDATTFGNHEFDLGPDGLAMAIGVASKAGRIPAVLSANTDFSGNDPTLAGLQQLSKAGTIRRYVVIERGGMRFGLFGVLGKEAQIYTFGGAVKFPDFIESAKEVVKLLRETEKVDVVIALSHGGVSKGKDGKYSTGDDVTLAAAVPGIDVVIGGHSHTELKEAIIVNGRTPVVQTGKEGKNVGELVVTIDGAKLTVDAYRLHPIDDSIAGDRAIDDEIGKLKEGVNAAVFASRGYRVDQPLAITPQDLPNTYTDYAAGTILANLVTDAYRKATHADIGLSVSGLMRASILRGKTGVVTVYDVFAVAPLGAGIVDKTAGGALVTAYFTGQDLKNILEFFIVDNPVHPGEFYPRTSGMRFRYDRSRPKFDAVTAIEVGDLDRGYKAIDITGKDGHLYSVTCPLMLGLMLVAIPKYTKGALNVVAKNKEGRQLTSKVEALEAPIDNSGYLLGPPGTMDRSSVAVAAASGAPREIKEWQSIMDYLRDLPVTKKGELPVIPVDARAAEVRAIKAA
ncbi:MAG TPA: bifunctional UDP-sugar hydrolase/5'-nucleotidase [Casimicrobiaceae bacterium]|nr:bifunctional UDP-sugar hydrolase/5'-nucleotidase [Casimicrobiaceae bacterium]